MEGEYTFQDLLVITRQVIQAFSKVEQRPWTVEATMIELMKQVGDLSKRIMTLEQYYVPDRAINPTYITTVEDIGDELADVFYCLIRIAEHYHIDLEQAHLDARRKEMQSLGQEPAF